MAQNSQRKNIVIVGTPSTATDIYSNFEADREPGGGIIGCTTAYYITRHPRYDPSKHSVTLIEASKIAGGASGKAGGLLALWGNSFEYCTHVHG